MTLLSHKRAPLVRFQIGDPGFWQEQEMAIFHSFAQKQMKQRQTSSPSVSRISIAGRFGFGNASGTDISEKRRRRFARLIDSVDSPWLVNGFSVGIGVFAGILEFFTHVAFGRMNVRPQYHALIDAGMIALMAVALVGVCFASARARRQRTLERIRTASDLNHHVRNALQVITLSRYLPEEKQNQAVFTSIDRIDEALKRLSPQ